MSFSSLIRSTKTRFYILRGLFGFLWKNKLWWIIPMIILLIIFFLLMIFAQSTPLGPLIYPLI